MIKQHINKKKRKSNESFNWIKLREKWLRISIKYIYSNLILVLIFYLFILDLKVFLLSYWYTEKKNEKNELILAVHDLIQFYVNDFYFCNFCNCCEAYPNEKKKTANNTEHFDRFEEKKINWKEKKSIFNFCADKTPSKSINTINSVLFSSIIQAMARRISDEKMIVVFHHEIVVLITMKIPVHHIMNITPEVDHVRQDTVTWLQSKSHLQFESLSPYSKKEKKKTFSNKFLSFYLYTDTGMVDHHDIKTHRLRRQRRNMNDHRHTIIQALHLRTKSICQWKTKTKINCFCSKWFSCVKKKSRRKQNKKKTESIALPHL